MPPQATKLLGTEDHKEKQNRSALSVENKLIISLTNLTVKLKKH
jgi:hypothetical protein